MRTPSWSITGSWLACGLVMAGCQFDTSGFGSPGGDDDDDSAKVDASPGAGDAATLVDAGVGGTDGGEQDGGCVPLVQLPFEPSNFKACDVMAMNDLPPLNGPATGPDDAYKIDTDSEMLTRAGVVIQPLMGRGIPQMDSSGQEVGPDIFLVATGSLTIASGAKLLVTGSRALVLIAVGDISVDGGLSVGVWDLAGAEQDGSGGDHAATCGTGRGPNGTTRTTTDGQSGGAGGGGGAFGGSGGRGGEVETGTDPSKTAGGEQGGSADLAPLRGGCAGGRGGMTGGGAGGHAGGALQLVAGGLITVGGVVTAHGGGGLAATPDYAGGGGGGSGGGILLEASRIQVTGAVTANGGGGGEGTRQSGFPVDGSDGHESDDVVATGGIGGSVSGGDGGHGGARGRNGEDGKRGDYSDSTPAGGGGGGGSAGRIRIHTFGTNAALGGSTISPDPVVSSTP